MYLNVNLGNQPVFTSTIFRKPFICTAAGELLKREVVLAHLILSPNTVCCPATVSKNIYIIKILMYGFIPTPVKLAVLVVAFVASWFI
jgi:hypothetical protein